MSLQLLKDALPSSAPSSSALEKIFKWSYIDVDGLPRICAEDAPATYCRLEKDHKYYNNELDKAHIALALTGWTGVGGVLAGIPAIRYHSYIIQIEKQLQELRQLPVINLSSM